MTKFVALGQGKASDSPNLKYVKQTYDAMSNSNLNLELVAIQVSKLPPREQQKFFRLFFNYIDVTANNHTFIGLKEIREICVKLINVINKHYEEKETR
jgi:hypothetical protein